MKRILYVNHSGKMAGAERCLIRIFEDMDRSRFDPVLVCPEGDLASEARVRNVTTCVMTFLDYQRNHTRLASYSLVNPFLVAYHCMWLFFVTLRLVRMIHRFDASLIHANTLLSRLPASLAGRLAGIPVIWHVRDILPNRLWIRIYDRVAWWGVAKIVSVSDACHGQFSEKPKVVTVYDGIAYDRFKPDPESRVKVRSKLGWSEDQLVVGIFGRITRWKGHAHFLDAACIVHKKFPNTRFLIVGQAWSPEDQAFESDLQRFIEREGLQDSCIFTGFRENVPELMAACDLIVVPSEEPDPFPNTVLEGMSCACAVLAFPVGGIPEAIVDGATGLLVTQMNGTGLAKAMETLINDVPLRALMGANGRRRIIEHFNAAKTQREIENIYDRLLS